MATIDVPAAVYDKIGLLARAWGTSEGAVVARLLDEFRRPSQPEEPGEDEVPVHVVYQDLRVEGRFNPDTERLRITTGPLADQTFRSPSGAAIAVVSAHNPEINPNRNGWTFWLVTATGKPLQTVRAVQSRRSR